MTPLLACNTRTDWPTFGGHASRRAVVARGAEELEVPGADAEQHVALGWQREREKEREHELHSHAAPSARARRPRIRSWRKWMLWIESRMPASISSATARCRRYAREYLLHV